MQASALDIIKGAMRAVNILSAGRNPTADETSDYLAILNQMLDGWNAERLMIFTVQRLGPFDLTPGQQFYKVGLGPGADISISRPPRIELITILWLGNPVQPAELGLDMLDEQGWASIPVKNIPGPLPQKVWDDGGFPQRTLAYWPIPTIDIQTVFYGWGALTQFPDQATQLVFPPGYLEALRFNLAMRLDNAEITPLVAKMADESKARIKGFNTPILTLQADTYLLDPKSAAYNWLSDTPVIRGRQF
jgi:hypothetical protein